MIFHNDPSFCIFFGDTRTEFRPKELDCSKKILTQEPFATINHQMQCNHLQFLHQVHGINGHAIIASRQAALLTPFTLDGDFLSTNTQAVGIGIATADCLPIVIYDSFNHVGCVIHAGWRGAVDNIIAAALLHMKLNYGTKNQFLKIFFGPCAKLCCYSVGTELLEKLEHYAFMDEVIHTVHDTTYFDLPKFCIKLFEAEGIDREAIKLDYNDCTICNDSFCSYRRSQGKPERQMTVLVLR